MIMMTPVSVLGVKVHNKAASSMIMMTPVCFRCQATSSMIMMTPVSVSGVKVHNKAASSMIMMTPVSVSGVKATGWLNEHQQW